MKGFAEKIGGKHKNAISIIGIWSIIFFNYRDIIMGFSTRVDRGGDLGELEFPLYTSIARALYNGEIPLWINEIFSGHTLAGYPQAGALYPFNWIILRLAYNPSDIPFAVYDWVVVFHIMVAGAGAFFLGRSLKFNRIVSFAFSLFYCFAPALITYSCWIATFSGFCWIPAMLACIIWALDDASPKGWGVAALGGLATAMCILASPAHASIMALYLLGFYFLFTAWKHRTDKSFLVSATAKTAFLCGTGLFISAPALLSIVEFMGLSYRFTSTVTFKGFEGSFPFEELMLHLGNPNEIVDLFLATFRSKAYCGVIVAILASFAFFIPNNNKKSSIAFFKGLAIISALGFWGILIHIYIYALPVFNMIREPSHLAQYIVIALVVLAGYSLQWMYDRLTTLIQTMQPLPKSKLKRKSQIEPAKEDVLRRDRWDDSFLIIVSIIIYITGMLYLSFNNRNNRYFIAACVYCILLAIVIHFVRQKKILQVSRLIFIPIACVLCFINVTATGFKMDTITIDKDSNEGMYAWYTSGKPLTDMLIPEDGDFFRTHADIANVPAPLPVGLGGILGYNDFFGYGNPVYIPALDNQGVPLDQLADLMNIRYIMTPIDIDPGAIYAPALDTSDIIQIDKFENILNREKEPSTVYLYEKQNRPGYAWVVDDFEIYQNYEEMDLRLRTGPNQISVTALVDSQYPQPTKASEPVKLEYSTKLISHKSNSIILDVSTNKDSLLIISELYFPGWHAKIDGKPAEIYRVNSCLRGINLTEGQHIIQMRYWPTYMTAGLVIAGIALLSIVIAILYALQNPRIIPERFLAIGKNKL